PPHRHQLNDKYQVGKSRGRYGIGGTESIAPQVRLGSKAAVNACPLKVRITAAKQTCVRHHPRSQKCHYFGSCPKAVIRPDRLGNRAAIQSRLNAPLRSPHFMAEERTQRRLAAILAADVVGYSRLMEQDEARTLAAIRDLRREVIDPLLSEHHGRIVKLM